MPAAASHQPALVLAMADSPIDDEKRPPLTSAAALLAEMV